MFCFSDPNASLKVMTGTNFSRQHYLVEIEKSETDIPIKKVSTSPSTKIAESPLVLSWAFTIHKVQVLSLNQDVGCCFSF